MSTFRTEITPPPAPNNTLPDLPEDDPPPNGEEEPEATDPPKPAMAEGGAVVARVAPQLRKFVPGGGNTGGSDITEAWQGSSSLTKLTINGFRAFQTSTTDVGQRCGRLFDL